MLKRWSGSAWVSVQDTAIGTALANAATAQSTANGKLTAFYTSTAPTTGMQTGDFWVNTASGNKLYRYSGSAWVAIQDAAISTALSDAATAQATADGKIVLFAQTSAPTGSHATGDIWIDTDDGNKVYTWTGSWTARTLGNSAITPGSLIASNVIATGTVTAALLETLLVLTSTVIAGTSTGDHSSMDSDGFHVYKTVTGEGVLEVGRFGGGGSGGFLGIVDSSGDLTATISEDGRISCTAFSTAEEPVLAGKKLSELMRFVPGAGQYNQGIFPYSSTSTVGWADAGAIGVTSEYGLIEIAADVKADHAYLIGWEVGYLRSSASTAALFRLRDGGTGTPTLSSELIMERQCEDAPASYLSQSFRLSAWSPTTSGKHRLLLTAQAAIAGNIDINSASWPTIFVLDVLGANPYSNASVNRGGGGTPQPVQQYDTGDIAANGHWTYRGNNTLRTDTADVVQGYDPSGYNGDGKGHYRFTIPNISGTVNQCNIDFYVNHTYYYSGATAIINLSTQSGTANPTKLQTDLYVPGFPDPGWKSIYLPASWLPTLRGKTSITVTLGPSGGTNETYYMRTNYAAVRIWYSQ